MKEHIRPLKVFKKINKEIYLSCYKKFEDEAHSKKDKENTVYWYHAYFKLNKLSGIFFWKDEHNRNNKLTITELGRLLMIGWYYGIEDYTAELSSYVIKAHSKKYKTGEAFNDMEIYKVVKHIRENIEYYYQNQKEAKYYLIESLFNSDLKTLLPSPPNELKEHLNILDFLKDIRKAQRAKGIDYWINAAEAQESYSYYLVELLDQLGVADYLDFKEWETKEKEKQKEYFEGVNKMEIEYKKSILTPEVLSIMGN